MKAIQYSILLYVTLVTMSGFAETVDRDRTMQAWKTYAGKYSPWTSIPPEKAFANREEGLRWMVKYSTTQALEVKGMDLSQVDPLVREHLDVFTRFTAQQARLVLSSLEGEEILKGLAPSEADLLQELLENGNQGGVQQWIDKSVADALTMSLARMQSLKSRKELREKGTEALRKMMNAFGEQEKAVYRHLGLPVPPEIDEGLRHINKR